MNETRERPEVRTQTPVVVERPSLEVLLDTPQRLEGERLQRENPDTCSTRWVAGGIILPVIAALQALLALAAGAEEWKPLWLTGAVLAALLGGTFILHGTQMMRRHDHGAALTQSADQEARRVAVADASNHHHLQGLERAPLYLAAGQPTTVYAERDGQRIRVALSFPTPTHPLQARTLHDEINQHE